MNLTQFNERFNERFNDTAKIGYPALQFGVERYEYIQSTTTGKWAPHATVMTSPISNPKLALNAGEWEILSLSLAPGKMSGFDICPMRTPACTAGCLGYNSGHSAMGIGAANNPLVMTPVRVARIRRTQRLFGMITLTSQLQMLHSIDKEIAAFTRRCARRGTRPACRMNAFSDIVWEKMWPELFKRHSGVQFYDYTKIPGRLYNDNLPKNYHLTLSRSEKNDGQVCGAILGGHNVAVVFGVKNPADMPKVWKGIRVIDGTENDHRFLDPKPCIVGLSWKGPTGKKAYTESLTAAIASGFAVPV